MPSLLMLAFYNGWEDRKTYTEIYPMKILAVGVCDSDTGSVWVMWMNWVGCSEPDTRPTVV